MKWSVKFKQEHKACCPPRTAWILREETVEAKDAEQAQASIEQAWKYNKKIVVTEVKEHKDGKQQGE